MDTYAEWSIHHHQHHTQAHIGAADDDHTLEMGMPAYLSSSPRSSTMLDMKEAGLRINPSCMKHEQRP